MKNGLAEVRDKNRWKYVSLDEFLKDMRLGLHDKLENLRENVDDNYMDAYEEYLNKVYNLINDIKKIKLINKKIKIASINGTNKIHKKEDL